MVGIVMPGIFRRLLLLRRGSFDFPKYSPIVLISIENGNITLIINPSVDFDIIITSIKSKKANVCIFEAF